MRRDDANGFLRQYPEREIIKNNPFAFIDELGVGELIKIACERGDATRKDLKIGICREHGGDRASVTMCKKIGLSSVGCSPNGIPWPGWQQHKQPLLNYSFFDPLSSFYHSFNKYPSLLFRKIHFWAMDF
jgi:hypothetical protein